MNKSDLISEIARHSGESKVTIGRVLEKLAVVATQVLGNGEEVTLPDLGKLKPVNRAARTARNPKTGQTVDVAAKVAVKFQASSALQGTL